MKDEVEYQINKNPEVFKDFLKEWPKEIIIEQINFNKDEQT